MEVVKKILLFSIFILLSFSAQADTQDFLQGFDPFETFTGMTDQDDHNKSSETLYQEALISLNRNPLAARSKLQLAIKKNPEFIAAYNLLSYYYLQQVGHYRLAYKYSKKAEELIYQRFGKPPYSSFQAIREHSEQLRNMAAILQNLDQYKKGLAKLIEYEKYGYYDPYLESSKAWIYFKLKKYQKGIEVAKSGLAKQQALGANLNILGILYSVSGDSEKGIETLEQAYQYERSLGPMGQLATPLNNVGEIYRETFREDKAVNSWEQAIRQPDGCENILPSYNLATINLEALRVEAAQSAIDNFIKCFAQYPLKNDEEHKAVQHLIQARVYKYRGKINEALKEINLAREKKQWFGKIGTDIKDLEAAILVENAELLLIKNNHLRKRIPSGIFSKIKRSPELMKNYLKASWYYHQAKISLIEILNNFEDAELRHTDSMLDYGALGKFYQELNPRVRNKFLNNLKKTEDIRGKLRANAKTYYEAFNLIAAGDSKSLNELASQLTRPFDLNLKLQVMSKLANQLSQEPAAKISEKIYELQPAFVINNGLELPVAYENLSKELIKNFKGSNLLLNNQLAKKYKIKYFKNGDRHKLSFYADNKVLHSFSDEFTEKSKLKDFTNNFIKKVFEF